MFQVPTLVSLIRFGEDEPPAFDFSKIRELPEFQSYLAEEIEKGAAPIKAKLTEVLGEKKKYQDSFRALESNFHEEEDRKALKDGRLDLDSFIDRRQQPLTKAHQETLAARDAELEAANKAIQDREIRLQRYQIQTEISQVALQNEFFYASAIDDLNSIAQQTWKPTDNGLVARDSSGNIIPGRNGAPITPSEWLEGLKSTKPHYFKSPAGSGSRGGQGSGATVSLENWRNKLSTASAEEKAAMLAKYKAGEITIQYPA